MKPIVLFGAGKIAEVVLYYLQHHSDYEVSAITVDREHLPGEAWNGLPVVPFDEVAGAFPAEAYDMFVVLGYQEMNGLRARKVDEARQKGYHLISYVHPDAGVPKDCQIGENCFLMQNTLIHPRVILGDNVFVWSGAMIGHHSTIGDHCWLTSCANISGVVTAGNNCFFAVNSTVGHGVTVGERCFIGANALVTKCTDDDEVFLTESSKAFRLNSAQFVRMVNFDDL
tara:strand:- start:18553 stop:19233 length:681 start_codon:yes stop_codon:yes gene_type:complete